MDTSLQSLANQQYAKCPVRQRPGHRPFTAGTGFEPPTGRHLVYAIYTVYAGIAQLVERNLAKVEVAGSNPVSRSNFLL